MTAAAPLRHQSLSFVIERMGGEGFEPPTLSV